MTRTPARAYRVGMPKRSRKLKKAKEDEVQIAARVVAAVTGEPIVAREKDAAAVALGRKGGLKGGKVRAARMSPTERSESASKAARARWTKQRPI